VFFYVSLPGLSAYLIIIFPFVLLMPELIFQSISYQSSNNETGISKFRKKAELAVSSTLPFTVFAGDLIHFLLRFHESVLPSEMYVGLFSTLNQDDYRVSVPYFNHNIIESCKNRLIKHRRVTYPVLPFPDETVFPFPRMMIRTRPVPRTQFRIVPP